MRYLKSVPRAVLCFGWCERSETLVVTVDADHAGCSEARRSTSSRVIQVNGHVLDEWSTTQSMVALSSGESEFVAIVKGIVMGLFTKDLLYELGWCISEVVVRSDSSAGRASSHWGGSSHVLVSLFLFLGTPRCLRVASYFLWTSSSLLHASSKASTWVVRRLRKPGRRC